MSTWARSDADKSEKRLRILGAALELFLGADGAVSTVAEVALRAGLAKGTVYLYFRTKEEIFLALLEEQHHLWMDRAATAFDRDLAHDTAGAALAPAELAAALARALCGYPLEHPVLLRLASLSHGVLERNIDAASALRFRRGWSRRLEELGAELDRRLRLDPGRAAGLLLRSNALLLGLWQLSEPAAAVRDELADEDVRALRDDFASAARDAVASLWLPALLDRR